MSPLAESVSVLIDLYNLSHLKMCSHLSRIIILVVLMLVLGLQSNEGISVGPDSYCQWPPETGKCRMQQKKFYYNQFTGSCETFIYGGCGGNENRFDNQNDCETTCKVKIN